MLAWFRRNGGMALAIAIVIVVFAPMFITIANKAPNYEPSVQPTTSQAVPADALFNVRALQQAPATFTVTASVCKVDFRGVTTASQRGICSVTIDRTMYPYVAGTGTSCLGIDLTWADNYKPERGQWVIRLQGDATFDITPITQAMADSAIEPNPSSEFRGRVKDQYGEGDESCGMLPAQ